MRCLRNAIQVAILIVAILPVRTEAAGAGGAPVLDLGPASQAGWPSGEQPCGGLGVLGLKVHDRSFTGASHRPVRAPDLGLPLSIDLPRPGYSPEPSIRSTGAWNALQDTAGFHGGGHSNTVAVGTAVMVVGMLAMIILATAD